MSLVKCISIEDMYGIGNYIRLDEQRNKNIPSGKMNNVDSTQKSNLGLNWKQKTSQDYFLFLITVFVALCASLCLWHFSWV